MFCYHAGNLVLPLLGVYANELTGRGRLNERFNNNDDDDDRPVVW